MAETWWDIINIAIGAASLAHNVQEGNVGAAIVDGAGLVVDIGAAAIPFLENGIDLSKSRPGLDFNPQGQGGFYVTNDLQQAQNWIKGDGSIIQFNVPKNELGQLNGHFSPSANNDWANFVQSGRGGNLQHSFDYVEGPMLGNPRQIRGGARPRGWGHQLAIFTDDTVNVFNKNMVR